MSSYSADQIKELTTVSYWRLRECCICGTGIGYHIHPERERVAFDSSCGCTHADGWREASWSDIARTVNMQTSEEVRNRMIAELSAQEVKP